MRFKNMYLPFFVAWLTDWLPGQGATVGLYLKRLTLEVIHYSSGFAQSHPRATKVGSVDVDESCAGYHEDNTGEYPHSHIKLYEKRARNDVPLVLYQVPVKDQNGIMRHHVTCASRPPPLRCRRGTTSYL